MRAFLAYFLAGSLVLVASALLAPQEALVLSRGANQDLMKMQSVDRTNKGDRLIVPATSVGKRQTPEKPSMQKPKMLAGCDPVFSPLAASAQANFAGRCVA
jgi:hypothetical protein